MLDWRNREGENRWRKETKSRTLEARIGYNRTATEQVKGILEKDISFS